MAQIVFKNLYLDNPWPNPLQLMVLSRTNLL